MTLLLERPTRPEYSPVAASATVVAIHTTSATINHVPLVDIELVVVLPTGRVLPVATSVAVEPCYLNLLRHGAKVPVRIDPDLPTSLRIQWHAL